MNTKKPIGKGLWGVLATPFIGPSHAIDEESLRREVALFRHIGAAGVVALGVFGEGVALDSVEQSSVVRIVCDEAHHLPVIIGIAARATSPAIEQVQRAVDVAGDQMAGAMVQVHSTSPEILTAHLTAIYNATGAGIVLQDYPVVSGIHISSNQVLETVSQSPFIVAIKSEAPPTSQAIATLTKKTSIPVFGGLGGLGLLDELSAGAAGAMTGFSWPEGLLETLRAWEAGGISAATKAFSRWLPLVNFEAQPGIGLALRKEMLHLRGIFTESGVRPPAPRVPENLLPLLQRHFDSLNEVNVTTI